MTKYLTSQYEYINNKHVVIVQSEHANMSNVDDDEMRKYILMTEWIVKLKICNVSILQGSQAYS